MTFEAWLAQATGSFPAGVRTRLAQEYRAHWEESGGGDPVAVLGKPAAVYKSLRHYYMDEASLTKFRELTTMLRGLQIWQSMFMALSLMAVIAPHPGWQTAVLAGLLAVAWLLLWRWPQTWPALRRNWFRFHSGVFVLMVMQFARFAQIFEPVYILFFGLSLIYIIIAGSYTLRQVDTCIRRTLALEGACA